MDARRLQDLTTKGLGQAARKLGEPATVYRPRGTGSPITAGNKIVSLSAWFMDGGAGAASGFGAPLWTGVFDAAYTQAGDYVSGPQGCFFIVRQTQGLPVSCALANRRLSLLRNPAALPGDYGGFFGGTVEPLLGDWPGSLLPEGGRGGPEALPSARFMNWRLLLPVLPVVPQVGDVVQDDLSQAYVVGAAEQSALGWRLSVRQVGA